MSRKSRAKRRVPRPGSRSAGSRTGSPQTPRPFRSQPAVWIAAGILIIAAATAGYFLLRNGSGERPWDPSQEAPGSWNVLLVSLDTTRPDRLAACGGGPVATPTLDRVLGEGFLFTEMITPAPNTLPAHASLMTGLNPYAHGVRENVEHALPPSARTVSEEFQESGYATAAFVAGFVLDRRFGLAQGFEFYEDRLWGPEPGLGPQTVELRGGLVAERAVRWIGEHAAGRRSGEETRPFFLFVHFFDAHAPYIPPPPYDRAYRGDPYNGELAYQDACLARVLDAIEAQGEAARTLVWVISDHGEALGEHGEPQHSIFLYDCTVRTVSILRLPPGSGRYAAGEPRLRIGAQTSLISVAPTLLDLLGIAAAAGADGRALGEGRSLVPLLRGEPWDAEPTYCETLSPLITYNWAPLYAVRTTDHKYIRAPESELYDLSADPGEMRNIIADDPRRAVRLSDALDDYLRRSPAEDGGARRVPTAEERERLRSLGYISGSGPSDGGGASDAEALPDPKKMLAAFDVRYQEAKGLLHQRRFAEAAGILREALRVDPLNSALLLNLATALRGADQTDEASAAYREALRVRPDSPRAWHGWGQALLQAGKPDSALWAHGRSVALQPTSPDPWIGRAGAHWLQERFTDAAAELDSALARGADPILVHGLLARLYRDELGDSARAEPHLTIYARLRRAPREQAAAHLPRIR